MHPTEIVFILLPATAVLLGTTLRYRALWRATAEELSDLRPSGGRQLQEAPRSSAELLQAVDAIAIEVERVSESQRFLTRVLTERGLGHEAAPLASVSPAPQRRAVTPVP